MIIRETVGSDFNEIWSVECDAFGSEKEAILVRDLLGDESAKPMVSLLAFQDDTAVGHILFTRAFLKPNAPVAVSILAPLAVIPSAQNQGVGGALITHGLQILTESDVDLVFVLGHPGYYPRHGFSPAGVLGFDAPYPIPEKYAGAWMVQALHPGIIGSFEGTVQCADQLNRPESWRE